MAASLGVCLLREVFAGFGALEPFFAGESDDVSGDELPVTPPMTVRVKRASIAEFAGAGACAWVAEEGTDS